MINPDDRVDLEEELVFLLRSLNDLDRERDAQDVDDSDYRQLHSGYVARAAAIQRQLESVDLVGDPRSTRPKRRLKQTIAVVVIVAIAGSGLGWLVAGQAGQRLPGQSLSGGTGETSASLLAQARQINFSNPEMAIELYTKVLAIDPDNIEALAYRGWITALQARNAQSQNATVASLLLAFADLKRASSLDPTYPDAQCFLGIVQFRYLDDAVGAKASLNRCLAANPPAEVKGFVDSIVVEVDSALKAGS